LIGLELVVGGVVEQVGEAAEGSLLEYQLEIQRGTTWLTYDFVADIVLTHGYNWRLDDNKGSIGLSRREGLLSVVLEQNERTV